MWENLRKTVAKLQKKVSLTGILEYGWLLRMRLLSCHPPLPAFSYTCSQRAFVQWHARRNLLNSTAADWTWVVCYSVLRSLAAVYRTKRALRMWRPGSEYRLLKRRWEGRQEEQYGRHRAMALPSKPGFLPPTAADHSRGIIMTMANQWIGWCKTPGEMSARKARAAPARRRRTTLCVRSLSAKDLAGWQSSFQPTWLFSSSVRWRTMSWSRTTMWGTIKTEHNWSARSSNFAMKTPTTTNTRYGLSVEVVCEQC